MVTVIPEDVFRRIVRPYERSWAGGRGDNYACEEKCYANLQSPNSKSLKLGCNAEDEPMLKREAEFSSNPFAPLFLFLSDATY